MGWIKVTVMTAAPPAMPTCCMSPGAAAAEVAMAGVFWFEGLIFAVVKIVENLQK